MYTGRWKILGIFRINIILGGLQKITQAEAFVCPTNPVPLCLVVDSTNPDPLKQSWARAAGTVGETDEPNVNFTAADIAQQKATHAESLHQYLECQVVKQALTV